MMAFISLVLTILNMYTWCVIISVAFSWLITFGIINTYNKFVYTLYDFFTRITEPALRPIRRILPDLGGLDLSPLVLILFLIFIKNLILEYFVS